MKGRPAVLNHLATLLTGELTAADLYLEQARVMERWGYLKLRDRFLQEAADERAHADGLLKRLLFLEGEADTMRRLPVPQGGQSPEQLLQQDLDYELRVVRTLNDAIAACVSEGDSTTRELLAEMLHETEMEHVRWLESQLLLIEQLGLANYLSQQMR